MRNSFQNIITGMKQQLILLYLASGDSITSLKYAFKIPKNTIYTFLPEVLFAIYEVLQPYMKVR